MKLTTDQLSLLLKVQRGGQLDEDDPDLIYLEFLGLVDIDSSYLYGAATTSLGDTTIAKLLRASGNEGIFYLMVLATNTNGFRFWSDRKKATVTRLDWATPYLSLDRAEQARRALLRARRCQGVICVSIETL